LSTRWTLYCALGAVLAVIGCGDQGSDVSVPPLEITTFTSGTQPDSDGYAVAIDGGAAQPIGDNDTLSIGELAPGDHVVELSDIADNCHLAGANPRSISMTGDPQVVAFDLACASLPSSPPPPPTPPPQGSSIQHWSLVPPITLGNWNDVWSTSPRDYFVVGEPDSSNVSVLHYDGTTWIRQLVEPGLGWQAVWGSAPNDVYAVGRHLDRPAPAIAHYDGNAWTESAIPTIDPGPDTLIMYRSVWGSSATDVYAVGTAYGSAQFAFIGHYDGQQWSRVSFPGQGVEFLDVWGTSSANIYAVGGIQDPKGGEDQGIIFHFDGTSWSEVFHTPQIEHQIHLKAAWGTGPADIFVVGDRGKAYHFDGTTWTPQTTSFFRALHEVWGASGSDVFSVASHGVIFHFDGVTWAPADSSVTPDLFGVWGGSAVDAFAVGDSGVILHGTP
jgi:hypothetical protein